MAGSRNESGKTLFPFPVVTDSALRQLSENGISKEMPVDILPMDVRLETGQTLTTSIWRTESGRAVYRTEAAGPDGSNARVVLDDGVAHYTD